MKKKSKRDGKFKTELAALKEKLMTSDDFIEIQRYFFYHLSDHDEFMEKCKRAKKPLLKKTVKVMAKQLFQKEVEVTNLMLFKYPKTRFYHGSCFVEGKVAALIFFEDIDMGMFSIVKNRPETLFIRFSMIKSKTMPEEDSKLVTPIRSKMVH